MLYIFSCPTYATIKKKKLFQFSRIDLYCLRYWLPDQTSETWALQLTLFVCVSVCVLSNCKLWVTCSFYIIIKKIIIHFSSKYYIWCCLKYVSQYWPWSDGGSYNEYVITAHHVARFLQSSVVASTLLLTGQSFLVCFLFQLYAGWLTFSQDGSTNCTCTFK